MELRVTGPTYPDLFKNAAVNVVGSLVDLSQVGEVVSEKISLQANSATELMQAWLTTLLSLLHSVRLAFARFEIEKFESDSEEWTLKVRCYGEPIDLPTQRPFRQDVPWRVQTKTVQAEGEELIALVQIIFLENE